MVDVQRTIKNIQAGLSPEANFFLPGTTGYTAVTSSYYWSSSRQPPLCAFQPATPGDVAIILANLAVALPELTFAIKAGSHIAPTGFNATAGLLIDMSLLDAITYNAATQLVDVGPGSIWPTVYTYLEPLGRSVNGATSCQGVGVAGFNLGGGYGNRTNQYGLAMDTVQAIEVVLPTGEIRTVAANQDPDIFWALKGGGNNFGIATKWTMSTYPLNNIYSVQLDFSQEHFGAVQAAIWAYTQKQVQESDVEVRFEWTTTTEGNDKPLVFSHASLFYDGPNPPDGLFDEFLAIPPIRRNQFTTMRELMEHLPTRRQTYGVGLANGSDDLPENFRGRYTHVMLHRYTPALIRFAVDQARKIGITLDPTVNGGLQFYPVIWPGHPAMFQNSLPSAWPRPPNHHASFPLPIRCSWIGVQNYAFWLKTLKTLTQDIHAFAVDQGCTTDDAPVYYNLSLDGTEVRDIYHSNLDKLVAMCQTYDPMAVMNRTGGFRIPSHIRKTTHICSYRLLIFCLFLEFSGLAIFYSSFGFLAWPFRSWYLTRL